VSKKMPKIWEAPQHTLAKIEILRSYLHAWFSILGSTFKGRDLWYLDGFAGPGEYTNSPDGSPIAAVKAADAALKGTGRWVAGKIRCFFIEEDPARHEHLEARLESTPHNAAILAETFLGTFTAGLRTLRGRPVNPFDQADPVFAFIDPFGAKGLSFSVIAGLLSRPTCEVLVNLDSDGIRRIHRAREAANHLEVLDDVFGDRSWEAELAMIDGDDPRAIVAAYKRRLRALPGVGYCFAFEMCSGRTSIDYHLVFASQHSRGLEKMKEQMRRIDQNGTFRFSGSDIGQQQLFEFNNAAAAANLMQQCFEGRTIRYRDLNDYALNESPFVNPKSMLKWLESEQRITVDTQGRSRKKGTFPEHMQQNIVVHFHKGDTHG
jgi:three-Cys-motif partner protein